MKDADISEHPGVDLGRPAVAASPSARRRDVTVRPFARLLFEKISCENRRNYILTFTSADFLLHLLRSLIVWRVKEVLFKN